MWDRMGKPEVTRSDQIGSRQTQVFGAAPWWGSPVPGHEAREVTHGNQDGWFLYFWVREKVACQARAGLFHIRTCFMCLVVVQDGAGYREVEPDILALLCWSLSQSQADNNQLIWHTNEIALLCHSLKGESTLLWNWHQLVSWNYKSDTQESSTTWSCILIMALRNSWLDVTWKPGLQEMGARNLDG